MDSLLRRWGEDSIRLYLPGAFIIIEGLSQDQCHEIGRDYAGVMAGPEEGRQAPTVVCHAERLEKAIGLPMEYFSVNGMYTPRKVRSGGGIQVIGFNFLARIERGGQPPTRAVLAVAKEEELSNSSVMENFLRILLAHIVLDQGGVMLHSAGIVHDGHAFLFCGWSNAGKTTLARKADAAGAKVLSDDINLVIPENGAFRAHKVPFTGEFGRRAEKLSGNGSFPLGGLVLLEKAPILTAGPVRSAEAVARLLTGCPFVNDDPEEFPVLLDILTKLVADTPVIRLGVGRDDPFEAVMDTLLRHCKHD